MAGRRYKIVKRAGRDGLLIRWFDGERWRERSTKHRRRRDAETEAQSLIAATVARQDDEWLACRMAYERLHLAGQSRQHQAVFRSAIRRFEASCNPQRVSLIGPRTIADYQTALRSSGLSPSTTASYLRYLRGFLRWAAEQGYVEASPPIALPRVARKMKGRPITGEEFDRMLAAARSVDCHTGSLRLLMVGLWLSGLRLGEALRLSWDDPAGLLISNLDGRRPMLEIPAHLDKGRIARTLPLTPDFVRFLRTWRRLSERSGIVFPVRSKHGCRLTSADAVGRLISEAGRKSRVQVGAEHHPTAHDLRRSFASRWATRVTPAVLRELMRHASISTTLEFYVGESAERTASEVWDAFGRAMGGVLGGIPEGRHRPTRPKS